MNKSKKKIIHKKIDLHSQTKKNLKNANKLKTFINNKLTFNRTNLGLEKNLHIFFKDILNFIKKLYKLDNKKFKVFEKIFNNWCDIIVSIFKQQDEFYMTNINIKCKPGGKRGKMLIPYEKWCEIDEPNHGNNIGLILGKMNKFFQDKKQYCHSGWDQQAEVCNGYYWDYINPMRFLIQDIDQKTLILKLDDYYKKCKLLDKLSIEYKNKVILNKSYINKINTYNLSFKQYLSSITNFNLDKLDDLNSVLNIPYSSKILNNTDIWYQLLFTLSNIFLLYYLYTSSPPSIITNDLLNLLSWLLLLISSFIKNT